MHTLKYQLLYVGRSNAFLLGKIPLDFNSQQGCRYLIHENAAKFGQATEASPFAHNELKNQNIYACCYSQNA